MDEDADMQGPSRKSQDYEGRSQSESESRSSGSAGSSKAPAGETQLTIAGRSNVAKKVTRKKDKKRGRRIGGVEKTRMTRRPRRKPKRKAPRGRTVAASSIYAARPMTSLDAVSEQICKYCGHRCCLRRYQSEKRQLRKAKSKSDKTKKSPALRITKGLEARSVDISLTVPIADQGAQAGSRAAMLSALFIKNSTPADHNEGAIHCQITPEMIHLTLKELSMWRQNVPTEAIFEYIMYNYPVNPNPEETMTELHEKLHIASIAGLVWALPDDCWRLTTPIERVNKLEQSHVTIFWKVYADTMKPLDRKLALQLHRVNKETGACSKEQANSGDDII